MSKSVLVLETPKNCGTCKYHEKGYVDYCLIENTKLDDVYSKPDWCPLRLLPEKLKQQKEMTYWTGAVDGWNQCIDEITGGVDDEFRK